MDIMWGRYFMEISTYAGCLSMLRSAAIRQLRMFQRITRRWHPPDDLLLKTSWVALVPVSLSYLELLYIYYIYILYIYTHYIYTLYIYTIYILYIYYIYNIYILYIYCHTIYWHPWDGKRGKALQLRLLLVEQLSMWFLTKVSRLKDTLGFFCTLRLWWKVDA